MCIRDSRCDVASFVPVEFWLQARAAVADVNPDCIWLAETVHRSYGCLARRHGVYSAPDGEVFRAFDLEYEYGVREVFDRYQRVQIAAQGDLAAQIPVEYLSLIHISSGCCR